MQRYFQCFSFLSAVASPKNSRAEANVHSAHTDRKNGGRKKDNGTSQLLSENPMSRAIELALFRSQSADDLPSSASGTTICNELLIEFDC